MAGDLSLDVDLAAVGRAKRKVAVWQDVPLSRKLKLATYQSALVLRSAILAETPGHGELRASVGIRSIRGGYAIGPKSRKAHLVIGGTKRHEIRPKRKRSAVLTPDHPVRVVDHPGAHPNAFVARAGRWAGGAATAAATQYLQREAEGNK